MSHHSNRSRTPIDPHGYQPVLVDEHVLTDKDRHEELMESLTPPIDPHRPKREYDWRDHLTPAELRQYEASRSSSRFRSPFFIGGISPELEEERSAFAFIGLLRGYARRKYAQGRPVWYGDGVPWAQDR